MALVFICALAFSSLSAQGVKRKIRFAKGTSAATIKGGVVRGDRDRYYIGASKGQKMIYHGPLKPFESLLLRSPIVPWSYAASRLYYDAYWYPTVGRPRVREMLATEWGRLFLSYPGPDPLPGMHEDAGPAAEATQAGMGAGGESGR